MPRPFLALLFLFALAQSPVAVAHERPDGQSPLAATSAHVDALATLLAGERDAPEVRPGVRGSVADEVDGLQRSLAAFLTRWPGRSRADDADQADYAETLALVHEIFSLSETVARNPDRAAVRTLRMRLGELEERTADAFPRRFEFEASPEAAARTGFRHYHIFRFLDGARVVAFDEAGQSVARLSQQLTDGTFTMAFGSPVGDVALAISVEKRPQSQAVRLTVDGEGLLVPPGENGEIDLSTLPDLTLLEEALIESWRLASSDLEDFIAPFAERSCFSCALQWAGQTVAAGCCGLGNAGCCAAALISAGNFVDQCENACEIDSCDFGCCIDAPCGAFP